MKRFINFVFSLVLLLTFICMGSYFGFSVVLNYEKYGLLTTILSFVIGVPLLLLMAFLYNKIYKHIKK